MRDVDSVVDELPAQAQTTPVKCPARELPISQPIRALDVVAIGPLMIWGSIAGTQLPGWARLLLGISGVGAIGYNGYNFVRHARCRRRTRRS